MPFVKFSIYTLMGSLVWNILLTYTGYILGDHWESVGQWVGEYESVIIFIVVLVLLLYIGRGIFKRVRKGK